MPEKLDRCVDDVKGQKGVDNAYAICNASLKEIGEDNLCEVCKEGKDQHGMFTDHKFKKETTDTGPKPMPPVNIVEHHNPLDIPFGKEQPTNEAVAIGGGLSGLSIGGKKKKVEETICSPCADFDSVHTALLRETGLDLDEIT